MIILKRKAQVSLFLLIGIILLVLFFFVYLSSEKNGKRERLQIGMDLGEAQLKSMAEEFILFCVKKTAANAIYYNGRQGGYFYIPNEPPPIEYEGIVVPSYIFNRTTRLPTTQDIEHSITDFFEEHFEECIDGFEQFNFTQFQYVQEALALEVGITKGQVAIDVNYPVTIVLGDNAKIRLEERYRAFIHFDFLRIHSLLTRIAGILNEGKGLVPYSALSSLAQEENIKYGIIDVPGYPYSNLMFLVINESIDSGRYYMHTFAFDSLEAESNITQASVQIPKQTAIVGYPLRLNLQEYVTASHFADDTQLFDIDKALGSIEFIPSEDAIGNHIIRITYADTGQHEQTLFLFIDVTLDNEPPKLKSIASAQALVGMPFSLRVEASDPENDPLVFSLNATLPLRIDPLKGIVHALPTQEDIGFYDVVVRVQDPYGNSAERYFSLEVKDG